MFVENNGVPMMGGNYKKSLMNIMLSLLNGNMFVGLKESNRS
jgi:hypothetical protein